MYDNHDDVDTGDRGSKGEKGDRGQPGVPAISVQPPATSRVAFSVTMTEEMVATSSYRVLKFNVILVNKGNAYDSSSGIFRVPMNGKQVLYECSYKYTGLYTLDLRQGL